MLRHVLHGQPAGSNATSPAGVCAHENSSRSRSSTSDAAGLGVFPLAPLLLPTPPPALPLSRAGVNVGGVRARRPASSPAPWTAVRCEVKEGGTRRWPTAPHGLHKCTQTTTSTAVHALHLCPRPRGPCPSMIDEDELHLWGRGGRKS